MATMAAAPVSRPIDSDTAWRAVLARDATYDGRFYFAVRSTGVYCKPSCAARRPKRENVAFFESPAAAEAAGFRACLRCHPREFAHASAIDRAVERATQFLEQHADRAVTLAELAAHTGVSASHLQRAFTRAVGMSPASFQRRGRVQRFKARLRAGDTVSRATYEAGFGSSSRIYEKSDAELGMTPAAYRRGGAGVRIAYAISDTPVGRILVATTERGVCAVALGGSIRELEASLHEDFPNATIVRDDAAHRDWVDAVVALVREPRDGRTGRNAAELPLDLGGSEFQRKVWRALQRIPAGERRTYQQVAQSLGRPSAARAVARACATNRLAVVIPCHRVVRSDGTLSGYRWGVERKARLLKRES